MKEPNKAKSLFATLLTAFFATSSQAEVVSGQSGNSERTLEEIVVVAQKRQENLQTVPITITAFTAEGLEKMGIGGNEDLTQVIPGLFLSRQVTASTPFLRGVGSQAGAGGIEPSVATYLDGVYLPFANSTIMDFYDVERVEVLKGPQGTLFGRNSTGGLIHIITKDPSQEPSMKASIGYGNYETTEGKFYGTMGFGESIAGNLALHFKDQGEGYGDNYATGTEVGFEEDLSVHSKWLISPNDKTDITLSFLYVDADNDLGLARQPLPGAYGPGGTPYSGDWFSIGSDVKKPGGNVKTKMGIGRIDHAFDMFDFVSISSYRDDKVGWNYDQDTTPIPVVFAPTTITQETVTQEFQFISNGDGPYSWLLGLYYYDTQANYDPISVYIGGGATILDVYSQQDVKSYAAFFENRYQFTDKTALTLGIRQTKDELDNSGTTYFGLRSSGGIPRAPGYSQSTTFDEATWRINLEHNFTDNIMAYLSYNRGYKMGQYLLVNTSGLPGPALDPEILDAYEIGFKSDLMDSRVRLNGAAFYYEYDDLQLTQSVTGGTSIISAPSAKISGMELEGTIVAGERVDLNFGIAYLDTEYDQFAGAPFFAQNGLPSGGATTVVGDAAGNEVVQAPDFTFNVGGSYFVPTEVGEFRLSANFYHNGGFYWDVENRVKESSYGILNAELSWTSLNEKYRVRLWGRNLTDEEYSLYTIAGPLGDSYAFAPPMTYGIEFELNLK